MLGIFVGTILTGLSMLASTARDMHANELILKKELAEIEAQKEKFFKFIELRENSLNYLFNLELEIIHSSREILKFANTLTLSIDKLPENDRRIDKYFNTLYECTIHTQQILMSPPKFYNVENINSLNNIPLDNLSKFTEIGSKNTDFSQFNCTIPIENPQKKLSEKINNYSDYKKLK